MIKVIEIKNIKGIQHRRFELDILPNKPSLLVAPNGFGKSSLAIAFNSLNNRRIDLKEEDFFLGDIANLPKIKIEYQRSDETVVTLEASNTTNTISNEIDYFVINNLVKPKGIGNIYGRPSASLEIEDVTLVDRIPTTTSFQYSFRNSQASFGACGKVLPNINNILSNLLLVDKLSENYQTFQRASKIGIQNRINLIIADVNNQNGTAQVLHDWITANKLADLKQIDYLNTIGEIINAFDINYSETNSYLAAIQLIQLYNQDNDRFKNACIYSNYKLYKERFDTTLATFNCTWKDIRSVETDGKLKVKFPKATHISNGQRDILTFISMLFRAKRKLTKATNILIIDEVFDYLDDANLTAAQYYITNFITEYKSFGKIIYPLILTHLNPNYFKNFAFSKQKVYYLDRSIIQINTDLIRLLENRGHESIKVDVDKYLLHFNPGEISKRVEFRALNILESWGERIFFISYLNGEILKYLANQPYDPFAVCGALRVKIEELAYNKLQSNQAKIDFLATHKTKNKLEKAESMGIICPETHYLLGIIYNEGMHWKENSDNVSPIAAKLENLTIKNLIKEVFS